MSTDEECNCEQAQELKEALSGLVNVVECSAWVENLCGEAREAWYRARDAVKPRPGKRTQGEPCNCEQALALKEECARLELTIHELRNTDSEMRADLRRIMMRQSVLQTCIQTYLEKKLREVSALAYKQYRRAVQSGRFERERDAALPERS